MNMIGKYGTVIVLLFLLMPGMRASGQADQVPPSYLMTVWSARRFLASDPRQIPMNYHFDEESFTFGIHDRSDKLTLETVDLKTLDPVAVRCSRSEGKYRWFECELEYKDGRPLPVPKTKGIHDPLEGRSPVQELFRLMIPTQSHAGNLDEEPVIRSYAEAFADAINHLREYALNPSNPLRNFKQQAASWHAQTPKPPIPEEVRVQRLLAENAVKEKKPYIALVHYEIGLELYPTWPQGYFNAALIAAELEFYADAIEHMQSYQELVPDAPDAQAARDQIVIWRYKTK